MQQAITELAPLLGIAEACRVLEVPRSTYYRDHLTECRTQAAPLQAGLPEQAALKALPAQPRRRSVRALSEEERAQIRELLNSERFADASPREVYATLLDEGHYLCSWPTMYRILREANEVRRRRDQAR